MAAIEPGGGSITGVAATDVVVLDYGNRSEMKRVTVEELLTGSGIVSPNAFAGMYVYDGSTAQTVATGTTPILLTCFNTAAGANGLSYDCTPVKASNKITVARAGIYKIAYSISYTSNPGSVTWEFYAFNDGTQVTATGAMSKTANSGDTQCISGIGFASIAANKDIDLRGYHDNGGNVAITASHVNLIVTRVGN